MKQLYSVLLMIRREKLYLEKRLVSEGYDVFESEDQMRGGYYVPAVYEDVFVCRYDLIATIRACSQDDYNKLHEDGYNELWESPFKHSLKKKIAWCRDYAHKLCAHNLMPIVREAKVEDIPSKVKLPADKYDFYSGEGYLGRRYYRLSSDNFYFRTDRGELSDRYNRFAEDCKEWDEIDNLVTDLLDKIPLK